MTPAEERSVRHEIEKTLCRYAWSFDFDQARGIGECFTTDVEGDFGETVTHGHAEMVAELERRRREKYTATELTMHVITNSWMREISEQEVRVTSYCTFYAKETGDSQWERRSGGYYDDVFAPEGGTWRIKRRRWMFGGRL